MTPRAHAAIYAAVFATAVVLCLYAGRLGFMPLDQSIVFDAGWRILSGQIPYQDFVTPTAVVPGAMQAVFFAVLGATWFSYVLHAALVNGVFAVLVVAILLRTGTHWMVVAACGLAAGVFFYPPIGTPYPEQHALFFIVAALACLFVPRKDVPAQIGLAAAPLLALCAVMSKQNPGLAGAGLVMAACAFPHASLPWRRHWRSVAAGIVASVGVVIWLTMIWSAHDTFRTYFWTMPNEEAARRGLTTAGALANVFDWRLMNRAGLFWLSPLPVVLALLPVVFTIRAVRTRASLRTQGLSLVVAVGLYIVTVILIVYTRNQVQNAVGLVPLIVGLAANQAGARVQPTQLALAWITRSAILVFGLALALDSVNFHRHVNQTRMVLDVTFDHSRPRDPLPDGLSFLQWQTSGVAYTAEDLNKLVSFLKSQPGNILVLGDSVYLYALTGRPSANPNLWYHPGLTIPTGGRAAEDFARRVQQALDTYRPRYLILEGYRTWRGFVPMAYPPIRGWFDAHGCRELDVTPQVRVFECR